MVNPNLIKNFNKSSSHGLLLKKDRVHVLYALSTSQNRMFGIARVAPIQVTFNSACLDKTSRLAPMSVRHWLCGIYFEFVLVGLHF